jgi:hypothetical protein
VSLPEVTLAIVEVDEVRVGRVIAEGYIQGAIAVEVDEIRGVRAIGFLGEVVARREKPSTVAQEDEAHQRPMRPLADHEVGMTIAVHVADAHVRRSLGGLVEYEDAIVARQAGVSCGGVRDQGPPTTAAVVTRQRVASGGS